MFVSSCSFMLVCKYLDPLWRTGACVVDILLFFFVLAELSSSENVYACHMAYGNAGLQVEKQPKVVKHVICVICVISTLSEKISRGGNACNMCKIDKE